MQKKILEKINPFYGAKPMLFLGFTTDACIWRGLLTSEPVVSAVQSPMN